MSSPHSRLKRAYIILIALTCVLAVANTIYLLCQPDTTLKTILFCGGQYLGMLVILAAPIILRKRFLINVPLALTVAVGVFAFVAFVLGDGLDFYGKYSWWDSLLHLFSGIVLGFIGLWVVSLTSGFTGIALGLNLWNALVIGVMGLPGFVLLLLVQWVL